MPSCEASHKLDRDPISPLKFKKTLRAAVAEMSYLRHPSNEKPPGSTSLPLFFAAIASCAGIATELPSHFIAIHSRAANVVQHNVGLHRDPCLDGVGSIIGGLHRIPRLS